MTFYVQRHTGVINQETRGLIAKRYRTVTRAINREFYDSYSEVEHSLYVGSYGRCTAVDTSDIDIMVILPREEYDHFDSYRGNGQSRLLQSVRTAIKQSYSTSDVRADGQVVKIAFSDEMKFEMWIGREILYTIIPMRTKVVIGFRAILRLSKKPCGKRINCLMVCLLIPVGI